MSSGRRFLLVATLATPAAWGIVAACGGSYGSSDAQPVEAAASDAQQEAAAPQDPCAHVAPPAAPEADDDPNTDLPTFDVAVEEITLLPDGGAPLGFDLDGVCTCDTASSTAHAGSASCTGVRICDDEGGVDDSLASLFTTLATIPDPGSFVNTPIAKGRRTMLVELSHYNGRANDRDVTVGIVLSEGIREPGCPSSTMSPDGIYTPGWCGDDHWSLSAASVIVGSGMVVPVVAGRAYVSNYRIVIEPTGRAVVPFGAAETLLAFGSPVITATIVPLGTDLEPRDASRPPAPGEERYFALENGVLSGRILATDFLATLGAQSLSGGSFLCTTTVFDTLKPNVCDRVDLASTSSLDFDPQAKCDSLSAAVGFRAVPALTGEVVTTSASGNPCIAGPDGEPVDASASYKCP